MNAIFVLPLLYHQSMFNTMEMILDFTEKNAQAQECLSMKRKIIMFCSTCFAPPLHRWNFVHVFCLRHPSGYVTLQKMIHRIWYTQSCGARRKLKESELNAKIQICVKANCFLLLQPHTIHKFQVRQRSERERDVWKAFRQYSTSLFMYVPCVLCLRN